MNRTPFQKRTHRLLERFAALDIDGIVLHDMDGVRYFSGFTGSHGRLIISESSRVLFTDQRYTEQAESEAPGWDIVTCGIDRFADLASAIRHTGIHRLGFESEILSVSEYRRLESSLNGVELIPTTDLSLEIRATKDEREIGLIRRALEISEAALAELMTEISPGMSEREVAVRLDELMYRLGSEKQAFDTIVAVGRNTSKPHHSPGGDRIGPEDAILFDFGAQVGGYKSDISRMAYLGREPEAFIKLRETTEKALETVEQNLKPGMTGKDADTLARGVFDDRNLEEFTLRGLGHGVGLAIHEWPRLTMDSEMVLMPGMVCTVEPGVYLPGTAGVRLENLIHITETGVETLNRSPLIYENIGRQSGGKNP